MLLFRCSSAPFAESYCTQYSDFPVKFFPLLHHADSKAKRRFDNQQPVSSCYRFHRISMYSRKGEHFVSFSFFLACVLLCRSFLATYSHSMGQSILWNQIFQSTLEWLLCLSQFLLAVSFAFFSCKKWILVDVFGGMLQTFVVLHLLLDSCAAFDGFCYFHSALYSAIMRCCGSWIGNNCNEQTNKQPQS